MLPFGRLAAMRGARLAVSLCCRLAAAARDRVVSMVEPAYQREGVRTRPRVLVACEFSGLVRDAFIAQGVDAVSCDLESSERPGPHIQGDVLVLLDAGWDAMIAFPPCTHLAASGARWWKEKRADGRQQAAIDFFMALAGAPVKHVAIENPVGVMSKAWRPPDQYIQPFWFGDSVQKKTGLWLKNLPLLAPTNMVDRGPIYTTRRGTKLGSAFLMLLPQNKDRTKIRSRTFRGIARAMAVQWAPIIKGDAQ